MTELSATDCFNSALEAYRNGDFGQAVAAFLLGLQEDKNNWGMRLYLGMTYARLGNTREAKQEFLLVRDMSPDPELRKKAASAVNVLSPTASQANIKKLSNS
jgi:Flp pilus assembly protein TadD